MDLLRRIAVDQQAAIICVTLPLMGTFQTWRRTLRMSDYRGRPEVLSPRSK